MNIFGFFSKRAWFGNGAASAASQAPSATPLGESSDSPRESTESAANSPLAESNLSMDSVVVPQVPQELSSVSDKLNEVEQVAHPQQVPEPVRESPVQAAPAYRPMPRGLMDLPELRKFLDDNHFGLGRHNGSNFRTADARERGIQAIVSVFQNIVASLSAQKQVQIDRLKDAILETEGVCDMTSKRLQMAVQKCEREMATLREQIDLAANGQGWVQQPIDRYKLGFSQGLKAAMDADLLGF